MWFSSTKLLCVDAFNSTCFKRQSCEAVTAAARLQKRKGALRTLRLSNQPHVDRRLSTLLAIFTTAQNDPRQDVSRCERDLSNAAHVLDLVLEILLDADLGLAELGNASQRVQAWKDVRELIAPRNNAKFRMSVSLAGGYDLQVLVNDILLRSEGISFEALAMTLRSFAAVDVTQTC